MNCGCYRSLQTTIWQSIQQRLGPEWAKNVDVRRALALAIDKESLVDVLGGDSFYPVLNGFVPEGVAGDTDTFRAEGDADGYTLTYDPDQAKELLAELAMMRAIRFILLISIQTMESTVMWQLCCSRCGRLLA